MPSGNLQGRMKRKGTRKGMMAKEQPHVQKLMMIAMKMMSRIVIEKIQHPPRSLPDPRTRISKLNKTYMQDRRV